MVYDWRISNLGLELWILFLARTLKLYCNNSDVVCIDENSKSGSQSKLIKISIGRKGMLKTIKWFIENLH